MLSDQPSCSILDYNSTGQLKEPAVERRKQILRVYRRAVIGTLHVAYRDISTGRFFYRYLSLRSSAFEGSRLSGVFFMSVFAQKVALAARCDGRKKTDGCGGYFALQLWWSE